MRGLLLLAAVVPLASGQPRVVLVDIDGVRADTFEDVYLKGALPNFSRLLGPVRNGKGFSTAVWFENATSVFPSVTMAGQASIFTVPPARHGIPGNQWFDRASGRVIKYLLLTGTPCVYGFLPIGVGDCSSGLANRHLQSPTIYEAATAASKTSTVVFSQFWKGSTHAVQPSVGEITLLVQGGTIDYGRFDSAMMAHAVASIRQYGLPDLLTVYFDGADDVGHVHSLVAQATDFEKAIDPLMGNLLDPIERQTRTGGVTRSSLLPITDAPRSRLPHRTRRSRRGCGRRSNAPDSVRTNTGSWRTAERRRYICGPDRRAPDGGASASRRRSGCGEGVIRQPGTGGRAAREP